MIKCTLMQLNLKIYRDMCERSDEISIQSSQLVFPVHPVRFSNSIQLDYPTNSNSPNRIGSFLLPLSTSGHGLHFVSWVGVLGDSDKNPLAVTLSAFLGPHRTVWTAVQYLARWTDSRRPAQRGAAATAAASEQVPLWVSLLLLLQVLQGYAN